MKIIIIMLQIIAYIIFQITRGFSLGDASNGIRRIEDCREKTRLFKEGIWFNKIHMVILFNQTFSTKGVWLSKMHIAILVNHTKSIRGVWFSKMRYDEVQNSNIGIWFKKFLFLKFRYHV